MSEQERLNNITFSSYTGLNGKLITSRYRSLKPYFRGKICLELGCADGQGTKHLLSYFDHVTAVDGSASSIKALQERYKNPKLSAVTSLFEAFETDVKYDTIVMEHILEHVEHPIEILRRSQKWLNRDGVILVDVPNARSLHRQAGVHMGLLKKCTDLNKADLSIGHRRVYTLETLQKDIEKSGLCVLETGGFFIKPLSNKQIEDSWSEALIDAYYTLGAEYPDIAAEIFAVCKAL
ncbi:MAG: class I SAM-dependent methyltransferase [Candidatus Kerfeldbacteria bacterium]|nr:class I SAM-dependent methyltransferase [Candidatus Kerfeldbacteria bacterium]